MRKTWTKVGPYSVNTQGQLAADDYLIRDLEEIKKGYYKAEGRREAVIEQKIAVLENKVSTLDGLITELKKNLSIVLLIGSFINSILDWIRARGGGKPAI